VRFVPDYEARRILPRDWDSSIRISSDLLMNVLSYGALFRATSPKIPHITWDGYLLRTPRKTIALNVFRQQLRVGAERRIDILAQIPVFDRNDCVEAFRTFVEERRNEPGLYLGV